MSGSTPSCRLPIGTLVRFLASRPFWIGVRRASSWSGDLKGSLGIVVGSAESGRDLLVAPVGTPDAPDFVNVQPSTVEVCCVDQQKLWDIVAKSIGELASPPETRRERLFLIQSLNENAYSGRFLLFWRKGGGYTSSLDSAARYTATQALAAVPYGSAAFWPLDELRDRSTPCVHQERVEFGADRVPSLRRTDLVAIVDGPHAGGEPPEVASELRPSLFELTGLSGELPGNGADS
jgi:hypothetical protein